ncbi:MAG TPA: 3-isopropylmalate dehydratase small subunit [Xanthobacteraceae bacterium]|jgi:3-isopropylmalate/(R)-2-methylmalate dehydratase small subunit|nr:3-isopropylmalate dehydratase small subunit [Xanthobacteraceae bacterium]
MQAFKNLDAVAVPIARPNVDTDQIVPARYLRKPRKLGFGNYLFHDLRLDKDGRERDFVLNKPPYRDAKILVAERNFGCGSSREAAVYALWDYGFRAVVAPSFGDIFFGNSFMNGLLLVVLPAADVAALIGALEAKPGAHMQVDLAAQTVTGADGKTYRFDIDAYRKRCLIEGLDELAFTLSQRDAIKAFEARQATATPWV